MAVTLSFSVPSWFWIVCILLLNFGCGVGTSLAQLDGIGLQVGGVRRGRGVLAILVCRIADVQGSGGIDLVLIGRGRRAEGIYNDDTLARREPWKWRLSLRRTGAGHLVALEVIERRRRRYGRTRAATGNVGVVGRLTDLVGTAARILNTSAARSARVAIGSNGGARDALITAIWCPGGCARWREGGCRRNRSLGCRGGCQRRGDGRSRREGRCRRGCDDIANRG